MKKRKITQEEYDAIPRDEYGVKHCPIGDYSGIESFGERCSFGKWCSFEGVHTALSTMPFTSFSGLGPRKNSKTYIWNFETPMVRCGCFFGTVDEFKKRVKDNEGDELYLKFVDLAVEKLISIKK